jgi:cysteine-rich repeat protein
VWTGQEACDDGNGVPNDGCTNCSIDPPACGNGRIEAGETCDDGNTQNGDVCPADCRVEPCTPTATRVDTTVRFARPTGTSVGGIVVYITYPDGRISLPGTGLEISVKARVTNPQSGFTINTNDFDYAIRVAESAANRTLNPANPLFRISYDLCQGETAPAAAAFTCTVLDVSTPLGDPLPLTGISCSVTVP